MNIWPASGILFIAFVHCIHVSSQSQIRIAALNAASQAADEHEDAFRSTKPSQTKEAQVSQSVSCFCFTL